MKAPRSTSLFTKAMPILVVFGLVVSDLVKLVHVYQAPQH
ncbi:hypothetical protein ACPOL_2721 [Acidisarcina polymorpha]|uniref:Uncharacterized protein n=1 Tax=Acidisarcina polymorpha TaxID=2211140 RepID=A0A2Z5FZT1_9BACT|nr:hypothetical protein ACPOL_2721 [Acidisarcina polymorpha]